MSKAKKKTHSHGSRPCKNPHCNGPINIHQMYEERKDKDSPIIIGVFPDSDNPVPFAYTVGLVETLGYEVLTVGVRADYVAGVMGRVWRALRTGHAHLDRRLLMKRTGAVDLPLVAARTDDKVYPLLSVPVSSVRSVRDMVFQADLFHRKAIDVVQILMPDDKMRLPIDEGYETRSMPFQGFYVSLEKLRKRMPPEPMILEIE